jgi:peptide subunit release factor 1 (eRF1)
MTKNCPKCGAECEGEDLGDHPCYLSFCCEECGHTFDYNAMPDMVDHVRTMYKDEGGPI